MSVIAETQKERYQMAETEKSASSWTFLTNYSHVLVCLLKDPNLTIREMAFKIGITERMVSLLVSDLEKGGIITRERIGRRNSYKINLDAQLRHPLEQGHTVGDLLCSIAREPARKM